MRVGLWLVALSLYLIACTDPKCHKSEIKIGLVCFERDRDGGASSSDAHVSAESQDGSARPDVNEADASDSGSVDGASNLDDANVSSDAQPSQSDAGSTCDKGFVRDERGNCADQDECQLGTDDCFDSPSACVNDSGSYHCTCPSGYKGDGKGSSGCVDLDECALKIARCDPLAECHNTAGSYTCGACTQGYIGGAGGVCVDACTSNNGGCSSDATCVHPVGSNISCVCPAGTSGNGVGNGGCVDICSVNNGGCHKNASCSHVGNAVSCKCPAPTLGANVVSDPGFEGQSSLLGSPWRSDPYNSVAPSYDVILGHGSAKAARMLFADGAASIWQRVVVLPNARYRLSAWGRGSASNAVIAVARSGNDSMDQPNGGDYATVGPFSGVNWMTSTVEFDTGTFTAFSLVAHALSSTSTNSSFEMDDITLQQIITADCQ